MANIDVQRRPELPPPDKLGDAIDTAGAGVGRAVGYLTSRRPSEIRADAERVIVGSPFLALAAALGVGYLVGSRLRS